MNNPNDRVFAASQLQGKTTDQLRAMLRELGFRGVAVSLLTQDDCRNILLVDPANRQARFALAVAGRTSRRVGNTITVQPASVESESPTESPTESPVKPARPDLEEGVKVVATTSDSVSRSLDDEAEVELAAEAEAEQGGDAEAESSDPLAVLSRELTKLTKAAAQLKRQQKLEAAAKAAAVGYVRGSGPTVDVAGITLPVLNHDPAFVPPDADDLKHFDPKLWRAGMSVAGMEIKADIADLAKLYAARLPIYIFGDRGMGKTLALRWLAWVCRHGFIRLQGAPDLTSDWIVGCRISRGGETPFQYGPLPIGMTGNEKDSGYIVLIDEMGLCPGESTAIFHQVGEAKGRGSLTLVQEGGLVIQPKADFMLAVTDNSAGFGDDSGQYAGVRVQNAAMLERWPAKIRMRYPDAADELTMFERRFPSLDKAVAKAMVTLADETRKAKGSVVVGTALGSAISTRMLVQWASLLAAGISFPVAFVWGVVEHFPPTDHAVLLTLAQKHLPMLSEVPVPGGQWKGRGTKYRKSGVSAACFHCGCFPSQHAPTTNECPAAVE